MLTSGSKPRASKTLSGVLALMFAELVRSALGWSALVATLKSVKAASMLAKAAWKVATSLLMTAAEAERAVSEKVTILEKYIQIDWGD